MKMMGGAETDKAVLLCLLELNRAPHIVHNGISSVVMVNSIGQMGVDLTHNKQAGV